MHFKNIALAAITALAPAVAAVGSATVENHCDNNAYLWSVGSSVSEQHTITPGNVYSEEYRHDPKSGGIALKITRVEGGLFDGSPQTIFAYTLSGDRVFYDLSDVFGDAFKDNVVVLSSSNPDCPEIRWDHGVPPSGTATRDCSSNEDLTLTLCA